jgi:hypothetical protein
MFHWLADHRRKKLTQAPFPAEWEDIICRNVAHYCMLDNAGQIGGGSRYLNKEENDEK